MKIPLGYNGAKYTPQYAKIQAIFNKNANNLPPHKNAPKTT